MIEVVAVHAAFLLVELVGARSDLIVGNRL